MDSSRESGKVAEISAATAPSLERLGTNGRLTRAASAISTAPPPEEDARAMIKAFRRKKYIRTRLLQPLLRDDASHHHLQQQQQQRRRASPRKPASSSGTRHQLPHAPLSVETQVLLERLPAGQDPHDRENEDEDDGNNHEEDDDGDDDDIETLQRVHALLASQDEIDRWIATYETEKAQFSSFALFTEMKLDEIHDKYVRFAGRPNAVEAAACCATLLKMPGVVGCYRSLVEKLMVGIQSVVYLPDASEGVREDQPMATIVRGFFARKPYFQRMQELEMQLRDARSLTDPNVLCQLTVDEIKTMVTQIPVRTMCEGVVNAYALHLPHLDHLLAMVHEKKLQLQLEFYQLHGRRRRVLKRRSTNGAPDDDGDDDDDDDVDDPNYPILVPLTSSAQICRAITQHAAAFSSSGKEMILCSILEHIEVDSFKDVFKRFDAHGKTCFLHHLSVLESSDHLQLILEQLPNAGDTLFRFYYVICGGGGSGRLDEGGGINPKHVFFQKVLSAEMEFFFLCDLAAYLNDEQWILLSQEYEKHAQERKARRKRQRRRKLAGADDVDGGDGEAADGEDVDGEDEEIDLGEDLHPKKTAPSGPAASLEHFQVMVWNFIHHHKCTSAQIWALVHSVLFPSLEENENLACIDHCMDRMTISNRWQKLLALVEETEADSGAHLSELADAEIELVRRTRTKMLKRLFAMLSREERATWMDKTTAKYGVMTNKPPPPMRKEVTPIMAVQAPAKLSLEDPKPFLAQMRLDLKMLWIEALLNAVANDKETSARTAMLKQVLVPFLNGQMPLVVTQTTPPPERPKPMTLADAEDAINTILLQLKQKNPADENKLWQKIIPESLKAKVTAKTDRGVSPIPELASTVESAKPAAAPTLTPSCWEGAGSDSDIAKAFRALLEVKTETEVLEILRRGKDAPAPVDGGHESDTDDDGEIEMSHGSTGFRSALKRKVSAVIAVAEPMEWHERVKVGMLDEMTQTDFAEPPPVAAPVAQPLVVVSRAPLTLSALLGRGGQDKGGSSSPRKKGDAKFAKLNSAAVPRAISGLITSWRVNTDQLIQFAKKSMPTVLRLIADAYGELLTAGKRKAHFQSVVVGNAAAVGQRGNLKELTLAQIVYQQFLHSYGLPGIADMHLLAFSCALEAYRAQHLRVEFFARFVFEEVSKLELANFLEFLECLVCEDPPGGGTGSSSNGMSTNSVAPGPVTTKRQRFVPRITVSDKENWMIPLEKAQEAAQLCFRAMRKQAVTAFCEKLATLAAQGASGFVPDASAGAAVPSPSAQPTATIETGRASPTPFVLAASSSTTAGPSGNDGLMLNADHVLQLVVDEWREEQLRREGHLLNVFRAGDVNGDGELTSAEFTQIVLAIDHTRDMGDILLMYSETLRRTQCDAIDADNFLQVAKEYELDRAAWNEDGDLRNIVNDMNELHETWQHTRAFFIGTLEALVRDLPSAHFLRVCEGAGCGCLKCLLDGYIGFQRMRRDYFTTTNPRVVLGATVVGKHRTSAVSEALLWARFWHLMRQLYEATSESAGILTAWDGADYVRVEPAPRPLPRYLKYRRMALPHFLFPDPARISGVMTQQHGQLPEVFDRDAIRQQFASLLELMTFTTGGKNASAASGDSIAPMASASTTPS